MKYFRFLYPSLFILLSGCGTPSDFNQVLEDIQENLDFGNISTVIQIDDSINNVRGENKDVLHIADSLRQIAERTAVDFCISENQVIAQIEKLMGPFSSGEKETWEDKGWLEWRMIDGEKKYFQRAASNLRLIIKFHDQKNNRNKEVERDSGMIFRLRHTEDVLKSAGDKSNPVEPVKMKVTYTVTVHPDAAPDGEMIRCWLPLPGKGQSRQSDFILSGTSNAEYTIAPDTAIHSTIYMEALSKKGVATVFQVSYSYISSAQYFKMSLIRALPYDKSSTDYQKYTSEQLPHICFTDNIKRLTDSITGNEDYPPAVVSKIYFWFKENIPWAGALEYSIMPNIPEYVIKNSRGDCGMQTFLFISMLRYKGIPARWQSGWMMPPGDENLHDWCEVYYEGTGWVPVDISYDLQKSANSSYRDFYLSGVDSYRLIVNEGIAGPLHPEKQFLRSEPYDFQRGEVEWKGGNLYFDKWDYSMKIEYIK
jgi:transglutaminase-like putative cysteine protease